MFAVIAHFKTGMIQLWSGSVASIPPGWVLCNGSNGTPDLRNRFLCGAGDSYTPGDTGGAVNHVHTADTTHTHTIPGGTTIQKGAGDYDNTTSTPSKGAITENADNAPLFHALAYIMKL